MCTPLICCNLLAVVVCFIDIFRCTPVIFCAGVNILCAFLCHARTVLFSVTRYKFSGARFGRGKFLALYFCASLNFSMCLKFCRMFHCMGFLPHNFQLISKFHFVIWQRMFFRTEEFRRVFGRSILDTSEISFLPFWLPHI